MMTRLLSVVLIGTLLGCASPKLRKWNGNEMTLCCGKNACRAEKWDEAIARYCKGQAKVVGGEFVESIAGFKGETTTMPIGGGMQWQQHHVTPEKHTQECRSIRCSSPIVPDSP